MQIYDESSHLKADPLAYKKLTVTYIDGDVQTYILTPKESFIYLPPHGGDDGGTIAVKGVNLKGRVDITSILAGVEDYEIEDVPK